MSDAEPPEVIQGRLGWESGDVSEADPNELEPHPKNREIYGDTESADDIDVGSIATKDDLQRALRQLAGRVDELEAELEHERERRTQLEDRLDVRYQNLLGDVVDLEDRVESAFQGAVQGEAAPDQSLPIMQVTRTWQAEPRSLNDTQRRAAMVWSNFFEFCKTTQTKYVLDSGEVGKILEANDENSHRETRRTVMDLVAELGRQYIELQDIKGRNALVIERGPFEEYAADLAEEVRAE